MEKRVSADPSEQTEVAETQTQPLCRRHSSQVKEDNTNRNDWSLRRISVLVRITDVKVRRAQVTSYRTGNAKIYEQPISSFNILMKWEEEA